METSFKGRTSELALLEGISQKQGSAFIPVYGRRRVGKSELLLHFIKHKKNTLYFLGKKAPASVQIQEFLQTAAVSLGEPLLANLNPTDWKVVIKAVVQKADARKKFILILDEFQWIVETSPELPSLLQEFFDVDWKQNGNVFLIVCGSYMGFMERKVLGEKSPLFGRRIGQIFLKPFSYYEAAEFFPQKSLADKAACYFICGGIPYYLRFFANTDSVFLNIQNHILNEYGALFREPDFLLREELRDLNRYYGILMALASGSLTAGDIEIATGIDARKLFYYLDHLIALGYVARHFPLCPGRGPSKAVHFILADPLLCFWFRFVYPHTSYMAQMKERESFVQLVKPNLQAYFGKRFEVLCREALSVLYRKEGVSVPFEIGEYWDNSVQIDIVGCREKDCIDIGECRWGSIAPIKMLVKEIQAKVEKYPNPKNLSVQCRIFSQKKCPANIEGTNLKWHSLEDLYTVGG